MTARFWRPDQNERIVGARGQGTDRSHGGFAKRRARVARARSAGSDQRRSRSRGARPCATRVDGDRTAPAGPRASGDSPNGRRNVERGGNRATWNSATQTESADGRTESDVRALG